MTRKARRPTRSKLTRAKPRKVAKHDPLDAVIDAHAQMLGIKIDKIWKPAIRANLQVIFRLGALVQDFKLPDDAEPAPVFEP